MGDNPAPTTHTFLFIFTHLAPCSTLKIRSGTQTDICILKHHSPPQHDTNTTQLYLGNEYYIPKDKQNLSVTNIPAYVLAYICKHILVHTYTVRN